MSMLAKTDSEVSSLTQSSPARSPRRAAYYVQSPSRDSHDGEKTTNSFHSSPLQSPMGSPPHSHSNSSLGPHSREVFLHALLPLPRPQKPSITIKSIKFDNFVIQAGADGSGVATSLVSMNSTVKLAFRNTATFFGVHVKPTPLDLSYSQLTLATGTIRKFYQSRKSQRLVSVMLEGSNIPLYGGGATLSSLNGAPVEAVSLKLNMMVRSRAYVLGKLVKPKFSNNAECWIVMDPKKMYVPISLKNKCTYTE
ncbi:Late embryogenesis abundant protein [Quillaja saponaria]|uniref:Late embryogenesis abundant protein n=1 Tax=Quillaja saponaria TaxID=32244 RepID=A0AAD7KRM8_QUISA|nr:Late embryogenesis abundant protein [Quillaja saponaria]